MSYLMIATLYKDCELIGCRIIDTKSGEIINASYQSILKSLKNHTLTIDNLGLDDDGCTLKGLNGSLNRYTKCDLNNNIFPNTFSKMVIISKLPFGGFEACNFMGQRAKLSEEDALRFANLSGIANGKVVSTDNKEYISAINGNYPIADIEQDIENDDEQSLKDIETYNKENKHSEEESVFNQEQKEALNEYFKSAIQDGKTNKDECIKEIKKMHLTLKSDKLESNYTANKNLFELLMRLVGHESDEIKSRYDFKSAYDFINVELPIPNALYLSITDYARVNKQEILKCIYDYAYTGVVNQICNNKDNAINNYALMLYDCIISGKRDKDYFAGLDSMLYTIYKCMFIRDGNANEDLIDNYFNNSITMKMFRDLDRQTNDILNMNVKQVNETDDIEGYSNNAENVAGHAETGNEPDSGVSENGTGHVEIGAGNATGHVKTDERVADRVEKHNVFEEAEKSIEQINELPEMERLKYLLENNNLDDNNVSIKIAKDILNKGIDYEKLSSKQKYRVDDAINIGIKAQSDKLGVKCEVEENNNYELNDHPEIKENVEKIISKADDVEMSAVLAESPNVINICYSILKNGKASDKQLKHVNLAIEMLNAQ